MANQLGRCDQAMLSTEPAYPAAQAAETEGSQSRSKRHHWVVSNPDAITRTSKTKKKEGTEIGRNQREKQHAGSQPAISQEIGVGAVGLAIKTLST